MRTSTNIYRQHDAAFANVSAYCIARDGKRVATVAFKFPRDGASRLWCYVHLFGAEMVRGYAAGYGYDKQSAACASAASRIDAEAFDDLRVEFLDAMRKDDGMGWDRNLRDAGFDVWQAV